MTSPSWGGTPVFEWDEAKNQANILKHGIDFLDAVRIFDKPTLDRIDDRRDYGEIRINSVGDLGNLIVATVTHPYRPRRHYPAHLRARCQQCRA